MTLDLSHLDDKTQRALAQFGAAEIMGNLADIPPMEAPNSLDEAQHFVDLYGPLVRHPEDAAKVVLTYAPEFRKAWIAKTPIEIRKLNEFVNHVLSGYHSAFSRFDPIRDANPGPVIQADFSTGRFEPVPYALLEVLVVELMRSRRRLKRCERPECQRHFVKQHARHRYCSAFCSEDMRIRYLKDWTSEHRDELKKQRAKRRSHAKRSDRKN